MQPTNFDQSNIILSPPPGMENCDSIFAYHGLDSYGDPIFITKWKLTQEEIDHLLSGKGVYLYVWGHGLPPVSLTTENPFNERNQST
jgi:hypothetical protein